MVVYEGLLEAFPVNEIAQKLLEYNYRIMLCYEMNKLTLINSITEELNKNRSLWWLMNDVQG